MLKNETIFVVSCDTTGIDYEYQTIEAAFVSLATAKAYILTLPVETEDMYQDHVYDITEVYLEPTYD